MAVATATRYLDDLKKQSQSFNAAKLSMPNLPPITPAPFTSQIKDNSPVASFNPAPNQQSYANPNEHFTAQGALLEGAIPQSPTDRLNVKGLQERDLMTAQSGDIASTASDERLGRQRKQMQDMIAQFGNTKDLNGLGIEGSGYSTTGGDGYGGGGNSEQLSNARLIASIAKSRGLGDNEIRIAIMTGLAESELKNINHGDRDSLGIFQQRPSQGWGSAQQVTNPSYAIGKFFDSLQGINYNALDPWQAAQSVQRSAFADGSNYQARLGQANDLLAQIKNPKSSGGSANIADNPGLNSWVNAHNNKYLDYDNAYGAQCVDLYAFYTTGFVGGSPNPVGMAPEILNNYDSKAYTRFSNSSPARPGDVAVFNPGGYTPVGHVAIVVGDNGNGTLRVLQSNATSAGSAGNSIISNISKATLGGYLRPRKLM